MRFPFFCAIAFFIFSPLGTQSQELPFDFSISIDEQPLGHFRDTKPFWLGVAKMRQNKNLETLERSRIVEKALILNQSGNLGNSEDFTWQLEKFGIEVPETSPKSILDSLQPQIFVPHGTMFPPDRISDIDTERDRIRGIVNDTRRPDLPNWAELDVTIPNVGNIIATLQYNSAASCCHNCYCGGEPTPPLPFPIIPLENLGLAPIEETHALPVEGIDNNPIEEIFLTPGRRKNISIADQFSPKSYLTTVGLQDKNGIIFCSGVFVSTDSILTAAHCVCNAEPISIFVGSDLFSSNHNEFKASLSLSTDIDFLKPEFCEERRKFKNGDSKVYPEGDIAMLHLAEELPNKLARFITPISSTTDIAENYSYIYGVGFGRTDGIDVPGAKHRARIRFESRRCTDADAETFGCTLHVENVTMGFADSSADSCLGDSGGPIFARHTSDETIIGGHSEAPRLIAITSRGIYENATGFCGAGAINTNIDRYWVAINARN